LRTIKVKIAVSPLATSCTDGVSEATGTTFTYNGGSVI
jgi:hypothetical protein